MEVVIQFKKATENSLDELNDPQSSWKYVVKWYEYTVKSTILKSILSGNFPMNYNVIMSVSLSVCPNFWNKENCLKKKILECQRSQESQKTQEFFKN